MSIKIGTAASAVPFVVLEKWKILSPQSLSQENHTKNFSKSQKAGFCFENCR